MREAAPVSTTYALGLIFHVPPIVTVPIIQKRSDVALGKVRMGNGKMTRVAPRMKRLKYSCKSEESAHAAASRCSDTDSDTPHVLELRKKIHDSNIDHVAAAEQAIMSWFNEIKTGYMPQKSGQQNLHLPLNNLPNFGKMMWESLSYVGCAVVRCTSFTNVGKSDAETGNEEVVSKRKLSNC
ncbi:SCP-like protein [Ancylostoma ceylanicum]|uniref:SCP-like protein n=1 Tax=Ancylostoma ceylanicum TaxID=53326 RepID=A0A0D6LNZ9_9BILA|nr:SCP-like protein [Ancylostoma ceylanicum]